MGRVAVTVIFVWFGRGVRLCDKVNVVLQP
jgi:hypothetical protein